MNDRFSFFRKLLVLTLFGFVPLLAMHFTLSRIIDLAFEKQNLEFISHFKTELLKISRQTSADFFYFDFADRLFRSLKKNEKQANQILSAAQQQFQQKLGNKPNCYYFNSSAELERQGQQPNRYIIAKLWKRLVFPGTLTNKDEKSLQKKLQLLFGAECSIGYLKVREGQLIDLRKKGQQGYLFWKRFSAQEKSGIFIYQLPAQKTQQILRTFGKEAPIAFNFWPKYELKPVFASKGNNEDSVFVKKLLENQMSDFCRFREKYWFLTKTQKGTYLGAVPLFESKNLQSKKGLLNFLVFLAGAGILLLLFMPSLSLQTVYMSINAKLAALVLIAIAIPSFGFVYTGILSIADHEEVLVARIENEQRQFLSAIEDEFTLEEMKFEEECDSLFAKITNNFDLATFNKIAAQILQSGKAIRLEIRGIDGEILSLFSKDGYFDGLEKTHDAFSRYGIKVHLSKRLEQEKIELQKLPDSAMTGVFENSDSGFSQILETPGKAHLIQFGDNELLWYCRFVETPQHPLALLTIFQARDLSRKNFLQNFIKNNSQQAMKLGIYNSADRSWLKIPSVQAKAAERLIQQAIIKEKSVVKTLIGGKGRQIAVALPGKLLAPFNIVYLTSDDFIVEATKNLGLVLTAGNCLVLLITLLVAQLLSQAFLAPIREISRGLATMPKNLPEAKVEISSKDELGELGQAFNQMIDDLQEMQLAKVVQDSLFPAKNIEIPDYELSIYNHTASELGGDYCDILPFADDKWLILIGDVSGHGTPAAMAMAMVKAAIFKACREKTAFDKLPEKISDMMLRILQRKKMMTMLFVFLDCKTHQLKIINAGHNWPIILENKGGFKEIKLVGMPLGIRRKASSREGIVITLQEGDGFFAYTDALIEGTDEAQEPFGFERFHQGLEICANLPPKKIIDYIEQKWRQHLGNNKQEDDLTMLALKRRRKKP